jgi:hypothetical protein
MSTKIFAHTLTECVTQAAIMRSADTDCLLYPLRHGPQRSNGFTRSFLPLTEPKRVLEEWLAEVAHLHSLPECFDASANAFCSRLSLE